MKDRRLSTGKKPIHSPVHHTLHEAQPVGGISHHVVQRRYQLRLSCDLRVCI